MLKMEQTVIPTEATAIRLDAVTKVFSQKTRSDTVTGAIKGMFNPERKTG